MLLSSIEDKISACFSQGITQFSDFLTLEEADATEALVRDVGLYFSFLAAMRMLNAEWLRLAYLRKVQCFPLLFYAGNGTDLLKSPIEIYWED